MHFRLIYRLYFGLFWLTIVYLSYKIYFNHNVKLLRVQTLPFEGKNTRRTFFTSIAKDNLIILSTTDYHYLDLALNLHQSIVKFKISNYVIGCTDLKACAELKRRNIRWVYFNYGRLISSLYKTFFFVSLKSELNRIFLSFINKTVFLRERKRHTASLKQAHAMLSWWEGIPHSCPGQGWVPHQVLDVERGIPRGVPPDRTWNQWKYYGVGYPQKRHGTSGSIVG